MGEFAPTRENEPLKLRPIRSLEDFSVYSKDGKEIGVVRELFFDDEEWACRYISVDVGMWLPDRKVILSVYALEAPDWEIPKFIASLSKEEVEKCPSLDIDEPVSRMYQLELYKCFGWFPYWLEEEYYDTPPRLPSIESRLDPERDKGPDLHLLNSRDILEYRVEATDGDVGFVDNFIMDEDDWLVHYIVVGMESPIPEEESSKSVLISIDWIERIDANAVTVYVNIDREIMASSPEFDPSVPISRDYEYEVFDHYGRPHYWIEGGDTVEEERF